MHCCGRALVGGRPVHLARGQRRRRRRRRRQRRRRLKNPSREERGKRRRHRAEPSGEYLFPFSLCWLLRAATRAPPPGPPARLRTGGHRPAVVSSSSEPVPSAPELISTSLSLSFPTLHTSLTKITSCATLVHFPIGTCCNHS